MSVGPTVWEVCEWQVVRFEVLRAVLLRIEVLEGGTLNLEPQTSAVPAEV
jgi:hypothetical protein